MYWLAATMLTTIVTSRFLGPAGRGVYVAAIGWATLLGILGNLSLSQVILYVAAGRAEEEWLPRVVGSSLLIAAAASILIVGGGAVAFVATNGRAFRHLDETTLLLAALAVPLLIWVENGNSLLISLGKLNVMNASQISGATAALILTFLATGVFHFGVRGAIVATVLGLTTGVGIALFHIVRRSPKLRLHRETMQELLTGGVKLHLNAIGSYLFTQANVLILNNYRAPQETAYYQLAAQLAAGMQTVPMAVSAVCYSIVARKGANGAWPEQRRLLRYSVAGMAFLSIVAFFVSPLVIRLMFGASFTPAVPLFRILLLGVVGATMSAVMASQWIGRGLFLQAAMLTLLVGLLTLAGNYAFVPRFGSYGSAWVSVGTYTVAVIGNLLMAFWVQRRYDAALKDGIIRSDG